MVYTLVYGRGSSITIAIFECRHSQGVDDMLCVATLRSQRSRFATTNARMGRVTSSSRRRKSFCDRLLFLVRYRLCVAILRSRRSRFAATNVRMGRVVIGCKTERHEADG